MDFELNIIKGQHVGRKFTLSQGERKTIGRTSDCEIQIEDKKASRRHCTLENLGLEIQVVDLGSANKTYINGKPIEEPYRMPVQSRGALEPPGHDFDEEPVTIPPGHVYVMGDNRHNSDDSRRWGMLPSENIIGKAFLIFYPLHRMRILR